MLLLIANHTRAGGGLDHESPKFMKIFVCVHMCIFLGESLYLLLNYQSVSDLQEKSRAINST